MSQHALPRQSFSAPDPGRTSKAALKLEDKPASLLQGNVSELPDMLFGWTMRLCGLAVVGLLALIVWELVARSQLSWHAFGWKFFVQSDWNPVEEQFGALPFIYGTLASSLLSLVIAVFLALGATRWEMIRMGVLRNARAGIVGAVILGLGRALGETMAVTMVIGNRPEIAKSLFAPGYTMASVLANEFTEATGDVYLSALVEIGLALFLVTIVVNALARFLLWTVTRGQSMRANA